MIEHVKRLDHVVIEVRRVLAPAGQAIICTENPASWHNVAALTLGYQPLPIGNRFALHAGEKPGPEAWQHVHMLTLAGLRDLLEAHGLTIVDSWGPGYYPVPRIDPDHAQFIAVVASVPADQRPLGLRST